MLALLTTLALTVSAGGLGALDAVADGGAIDATTDSSLAVSTMGSGTVFTQGDPPPEDPPMEDPPMEDPPMEDPTMEDPPPGDPPPGDPPPGDPPPGDPPPEGMPNDPPEITEFTAGIVEGDLLVLEGTVADEDPATCLVEIDWLDVGYTATPNALGDWYYDIPLEEGDSGIVTAVAVDSLGERSDPEERLVAP